jgi:ABC-2 type transport system ATP-binding protein
MHSVRSDQLPPPVLSLDGLCRRFGDVVALADLTFQVYPGEIFGCLGHNGAGKTTTVRLLNGLLEPDRGQSRVLGLDPVADGPALRRRTGVLTETPSLDERLTARDNLSIYADLYSVPPDEVAGRVSSLLESFELAQRADEKVSGYSKGMKQRLALARALLHRPEVLFLDEPTAGLDPVATRHVHEMITQLSQEEKRTVFLCTHNLVEAQRLCDRVAVLEHGRLVALGTPAELARRLGRSQRLEVEVAPEDGVRARDLLQVAIPEVFQEGHILSLPGIDRQQIPGLVAQLTEAGIGIYRVAPQEPSLEDVYFAIHGESEEGGTPRKEGAS